MSHDDRASSVDRVLVLLCVLRDRGRLRVQDAAVELNVAQSTAHRLLGALKTAGFAVQDRGRIYYPGPELTRPAPGPTPDLVAAARPHLIALSDEAGETVHLMVLEGASARFLDGVEGRHAVRVADRTGMVLPAHVTSGGRALLAELDHAALAAVYPSGLALTPDARGPDLATLRRELAGVRRRGYAVNVEQSEQGVNAIGACIRDGVMPACAAVVIAAPSARWPRRRVVELAPLLLQAARDIGAALPSTSRSRSPVARATPQKR